MHKTERQIARETVTQPVLAVLRQLTERGPVQVMDGDQVVAVLLPPKEFERMRQRDLNAAEALEAWREEFKDVLSDESASILAGR